MINNENYEKIKLNHENNLKQKAENLKETEELLLQAKNNNDTRKVVFYTNRINSILQTINSIKSILSCMRPHVEEDLQERENIRNNYAKIVNEVIPDSEPIVFHGNNNIEVVEQIIKSGGLFTPEQRDVDFKSFATQIDVTSKTNIRVSLEFADSGINSYMPYGALFVFLPRENEYENVLNTGESSEVFGGVDGIDFKTEPNRFIGIITTKENLERLKKCCKENSIDSNKIFSHEQFIEFCKNKFIDNSFKADKYKL
jgi:hypothetical protein